MYGGDTWMTNPAILNDPGAFEAGGMPAKVLLRRKNKRLLRDF